MDEHGQDAAFADFVHASWPGLYRTAHLLLGDHGLAEDLTQTALAKTYVAWSRIKQPEAAYAYARHAALGTRKPDESIAAEARAAFERQRSLALEIEP